MVHLTQISNDLPVNWMWTTLVCCAEILDSQRVPINAKDREKRINGKPESELYPYYGATGQVGWIDDYLFDEELVLLGEDGAPFLDLTKDTAYLIKDKSWVNNHAHVLKAKTEVTSNQLLCHYLNTFDYHGYLTGTTRLKLNQSAMRKIPIPLPPLAEQHRIVAKLEILFTQLDAAVDNLKKAHAQLQRYRQSVLKAAFEGELTRKWREGYPGKLEPMSISKVSAMDSLPELPDSWVWTTLEEISEIILGQSPPSSTYNTDRDGLPFYQGKLEFGKLYPTPRKWCTTPKKIAKKGDVFISIRAPVGPTNLCPEDSAVGRGLAAIRPLHGIQSFFVLYLMRRFENEIASRGTGTTFKAITGNQLKTFQIPLPSLTEQEQIVAELEHYLSIADEVEATLDEELKRAERLRRSILKHAFSGKLVPQDPDDEPASVLLEKIRDEKEHQQPKRKKRTTKAKIPTSTKQLSLPLDR